MHLLTESQILVVSKDVENEGINFSHLSTDLIDHICCEIEASMSDGIPFNHAYEIVKKEFNITGLRQIQQDTLMLIDKNYRIMKKSMKMIGVLAMGLMAFGALFKIGHWPGASIMLATGFLFTTLVFFPSLLFVVYRELNQKKLAILFIIALIGGILFMEGVLFKILHWPGAPILLFAGLGLITYLLLPLIIILRTKTSSINKTVFVIGLVSIMLFMTGLIFKLQHWPGASLILTVGSLLLVLAFLPMFYTVEVAKSEKPRIDFLFGIIALTYFIVTAFLLSINMSKNVLIEFKNQNYSFNETANYLTIKNIEKRTNHTTDQTRLLYNQADLIYDHIEAIKVMIVQKQVNCTQVDAIQILNSGKLIRSKESNVNFLLPENNPNSPLLKLKAELEVFNQLLQSIQTDSLNNTLNPISLFSINNRRVGYENGLISWEKYHFQNELQSAALNKLSLWQCNIRLAENTVLFSLVSNKKNN